MDEGRRAGDDPGAGGPGVRALSTIGHGDLKPSNVFLEEQADKKRVVKVADFGLARSVRNVADERADADRPHRPGGGLYRAGANLALSRRPPPSTSSARGHAIPG